MPAVRAYMDTAERSFCGLSEMSFAILEHTAKAENKEVNNMHDWKVFFTNPNTKIPDCLNLSYRYSKDKAKKEFHYVFPGVRIREIKRMDTFKAETELLSRRRAARKVKK